MKQTVFLLFAFIWTGFHALAQLPREIKPTDDEQTNFWNSTNIIIIVAVLIIALLLARGWAKSIRKKRDEIAEDEREEK